MIVFSNKILLAFSLYDLRCIILTIKKQIIAIKKGTFAPPAPPTERQEGCLLPPAPFSGVPASGDFKFQNFPPDPTMVGPGIETVCERMSDV